MFRSVSVILTASSTTFVSQMRQAGVAMDDFHRKAEAGAAKVEASSMRAHKALTGLAVITGTVLAIGLGSSVKAAAEFEVALRNVSTISESVRDNFAASSKQVIDLSTRLPQSAKTLAEGLYEIASSGFQGADGMEVLAKSATAASAGLTTTNNAAKGITAVLNAYGKSAAEAGDVSDILFQTVNLGVVTFEELSGQLGDFVGTAAQLGVPIEDAAAAFAAMTLSGISAAEASTSVNRVMLSFIKPSKDMAAAAKQLGFESSVAMVHQLGLKGAMEALIKATGGSVEAMARLFPEVRGLRGALALAAAEGDNYNRATDGIADANTRAHATQKALNEQMKSASAQWQIFRNQIDAGRIALGTALLPVLVDVMKGIQELGREALPALRSAWADVLPFFESVGEIGGNVVNVVDDLTRALGPAAVGLAGLVAGAALESLKGLAEVLADLTGIVAAHPAIVQAAAIAWGSFFLATKGAAVLAALPGLLDTIALKMMYAGDAATAGASSFAAMATKVVPIAAVATSVLMVANASRQAKKDVDALKVGLDIKTPDGLTEWSRRLAEAQAQVEKFNLVKASGFDPLEALTSAVKNRKAKDEIKAAQAEIDRAYQATAQNLGALMVATGLTEDGVRKLASELGVDLTQSFEKSGDARQKLIDHVKTSQAELDKLKVKAYGAGAGISDAFGKSAEDILAAAEAAQKFEDSVTDAFSKGFDLMSNFADATKEHARALEEESNAAEKAASAQDRVTEASDRAADARDKIVDAQQRAVDAQEKVVEANDKVAQSEQDLLDLRTNVAERSAEAQQKYVEDVQRADEDIQRAEEDLADKRISLAQDVADAQRRLEEDRLQGQERVAAAEQRIRDVQKRAADDAAERRQRENDRQRLDNAKTPEERQRIQAEIDRRKAREDEQKAREQAAKDLKGAQDDLQKIREENADKEKKNQEALAKAQEDQAKGIEEAERNVTKARKEALDVQKEGRDLAKQAVEDEKQIAAAVKSVEEARRGVLDAQKNAQDAIKNISDAERDAAKAGAEVGKAQADAARAYKDLADAQQKVADTSLEGFFKKQIEEAEKFATGIREAARQGLDPNYIAQLLQEGPEKAAPILEAIMNDQTGTLVRQMNAAREGLKSVQEQVIEAARVTHRAITTTNDDMIAEYGAAMDILAAKAAAGGSATSTALAEKLGIGVEDVKRIAHDYGIQLADGINPLLKGIGAKPIEGHLVEGGPNVGTNGMGYALGGSVPGQGDQDTVPAMLTPGEYVISKPAVQRIGVENLEAMHKKARRGYATGGFVYPDDVPLPPGAMDDYGNMLGYSGAMADQKMYYAVREFVANHPPPKRGGGGGGTGSNYGFQALIDYLTNRGVDFEVTSTTGGGHAEGSRHFQGLAADFAGDMSAIGDAFMDVRQSMYELIHNPGYSVKGGENVDPSFWGSDTWAGHANHVHAATFKDASEGPGLPSGKAGGGDVDTSGDIRDWIDQAMRITGVGEDWREPLYRRAMYESGGQNIPQGIHDYNTDQGTPAFGPFQVIEPTFDAYAMDGHRDWHNPVDNTIAAIQYIKARYGSIHEIDPPTSGYGKGGLVDVLKNLPKFHAGGMVPGDQEVIARLEGGEGVLSRQTMGLGAPLAQQLNTCISSALGRYSGSGGTATATPPIDIDGLAERIGEQVASAIGRAGIKVDVDKREIGRVVAEEFHRRSKR